MMQHSGADHVFKAMPQFGGAFHRKLAHLEVIQLVFALELLGALDTGGTDIDPGDRCTRPRQRVLGGLRSAAAGDQNAPIVAIGFSRPEQASIRAPSIVVPTGFMTLEAVNRRRVRVTLIKGAHLLRNAVGIRYFCVVALHCTAYCALVS